MQFTRSARPAAARAGTQAAAGRARHPGATRVSATRVSATHRSPEAPAGQRHRWALALTSVAFFMTALDSLVVVTALPAIHAGLGGSVAALEWTVNAYTLPVCSGIISAAALGDRFGRRRMYVTGLLIFTAASAACALAPDTGALIAARAIQGLGAALVTPLSLTILAAVFPAQRRGTIVGIWGAIGGLAIAGGPLIGGIVVQGLDWHWIFWINVPIGMLAAGLSAVRLPESRAQPAAWMSAASRWSPPAPCRWPGGWYGPARPAGAAARSSRHCRSAPRSLRHSSGGKASFPLRCCRCACSASGRSRLRTSPGFMSLAAITSAAFLMSQFFQLGLGYSPLATGLRFLPWTATPLLVAPIAGRLADRIGPMPLMVAGMTMQAAGLAWVALDATADVSYGQLVLPLVIAGVGISMAIPATPAAALSAVPRPRSAPLPGCRTLCSGSARCSASRSSRPSSPPAVTSDRLPAYSPVSGRPWPPQPACR